MKKIVLYILLSVLFPFYLIAQEGEVPDSVERNSLQKIYQATNGDLWYNNTGWLSNSPLQDWKGITIVDGDVVKIDLYWNDLKGSIPEEIGDLTALEELWLDYNELSGNLPSSITKLINLKILVLAKNDLSGPLPDGIGSLTSLVELDLNTNNFEGTLPSSFFSLKNLEVLDLSINSFMGELSPLLGTMTALNAIQIEDNLFEGEFPSTIGNLSNLGFLYLAYNLFEGSLPSTISNLQNLERLDLVGTPFTGTLPSLVNCPSLYNVSFANTQLSDLGDLKDHPDLDILGIYIDGMKLDFADIEPFLNPDGSEIPRWFIYDPQDSVNTYFNPIDFTYSVEVGGQYNQYQWLKNGAELAGATQAALQVNEADYNQTDAYQCKITNTMATYLTLWSKSKTIHAGQYYAIADGNWGDPIWAREPDGSLTDTTPAEGSEVFIIGKNVTLSNSLTTGSVHVIVENAGASLTVDNAEMTIVGTLDLTKETEGYPGNVKVINGGRIVPVAQ